MHTSELRLPRIATMARHALPAIIEGTIVPLAVFYGTFSLIGTSGAILAALGWTFVAIGFRLATKRAVSGLLVLSAIALTARSAVSLATGSVFLYFLQPTVGTVLLGGAFLLSVPLGRPLAMRLATDFIPFPDGWLARPALRKVFLHISLLWAGVMMANGIVGVWLLVTQSVGSFLLFRTLMTGLFMLLAVLLSTRLFLKMAHGQGAKVVFAGSGAQS